MYTIISGTNRAGSYTLKVSLEYSRLLTEKGIDHQLLSLEQQDVTQKGTAFSQMQEKFLFPSDKYLIILPEYNGSYPGIIKLMIDNSDVAKSWHHKKALLTGVSTGRAGNLRGMDHITGSLLHMKMLVHPNRLPISIVDRIMDENGHITDAGTLKAIHQQLEEFINF